MDLKALRDDAQHWSTGGQSHRAAERMAKCVLLFTCPDPLTLDAAVQAMGREPGCVHRSSNRNRYDWGETISLRLFSDGKRTLRFGGNDYDNPTIGLFALLVAAARMGESK